MEEKNCLACGQKYIVIAGHSCEDNRTTREVRRLLAKEMIARQTLEDGIKALDEVLLPIAKHLSGDYNKWRALNPQSVGITEASKHLINYVNKRQAQLK